MMKEGKRRILKLLRIVRNVGGAVAIRLSEPLYYRLRSRHREVREAASLATGKDALLVTVGFKRADLIEMQADLLRRHFRDSYTHVVMDNSPDQASRANIRAVCQRVGSSYVCLPRNPATHGSFSHGLALNWAYRNLIRSARVKYFGLLDHDILPFRPVSYRTTVDSQGSMGHFQRARGFFFYWAGLVFFRKDFFGDAVADFKPCTQNGVYLDTGGSNWKSYYSQMRPEELVVFDIFDVWADNPSVRFDRELESRTQQEASFTVLDGSWVHLVGGSNWAGINIEEKTRHLRDFLAGGDAADMVNLADVSEGNEHEFKSHADRGEG